jgi:hypothetical protein
MSGGGGHVGPRYCSHDLRSRLYRLPPTVAGKQGLANCYHTTNRMFAVCVHVHTAYAHGGFWIYKKAISADTMSCFR